MARGLGSRLLKNKIIRTIEKWPQLGCFLISSPIKIKKNFAGKKAEDELIFGCASDGRLVIIYPYKSRHAILDKKLCFLMQEMECRGAIVGCATNILDAWDIISDDEKEYKRKKRTYIHRKRKFHDEQEE